MKKRTARPASRPTRVFYALPAAEFSTGKNISDEAKAHHALSALYGAACEGDIEATRALVSIGADAAAAIEKLYAMKPEALKEIAREREHFPILHTRLPGPRKHRSEMVDALPLGRAKLLKPGTKDDDLRRLVRHCIESFEIMRRFPKGRNDLERRIESLRPLARATIGAWASCLRDWIAQGLASQSDLMESLARSGRAEERNRNKRRRAALKREGVNKGEVVTERRAAVLRGKGFDVRRNSDGQPFVADYCPNNTPPKPRAVKSCLRDEIEGVLRGIVPSL